MRKEETKNHPENKSQISITSIDQQRLEAIKTVASAVLELAKALNNPVQVNISNNEFKISPNGMGVLVQNTGSEEQKIL
jgi:hypothetical protein